MVEIGHQKILIEDLWNAYEILFGVQTLRGRLVGMLTKEIRQATDLCSCQYNKMS